MPKELTHEQELARNTAWNMSAKFCPDNTRVFVDKSGSKTPEEILIEAEESDSLTD
jgi:hypothetical protein